MRKRNHGERGDRRTVPTSRWSGKTLTGDPSKMEEIDVDHGDRDSRTRLRDQLSR